MTYYTNMILKKLLNNKEKKKVFGLSSKQRKALVKNATLSANKKQIETLKRAKLKLSVR